MPNTRFLEEVSLSAWPALQTVLVDGWVVRFSNGFGRRANSVNPLYPSVRSFEANLAECEALYARRDQRVVFKISPAAQPPGLDAPPSTIGIAPASATRKTFSWITRRPRSNRVGTMGASPASTTFRLA